MRRRFLSVCCSMFFILGLVAVITTDLKATDQIPVIDGSYLTQNAESTGYANAMARGQYLMVGYSKIVRLGPGEVYAGGTTMAAVTVNYVQIAVMVERVKKEGEEWRFVDGWQAENKNAERVASNRQLSVDGDYYYRVRCYHSANTDVSSSFTDGIYIEKP